MVRLFLYLLVSVFVFVFLVGCGSSEDSGDSIVMDQVSCSGTNINGSYFTISWVPPSQYSDETPLDSSDISGYRIYFGKESLSYVNVVDINDTTVNGCSIPVTASGTYYISMTTVLFDGRESGYSNELVRSL